jgi:tetratricopeptide (TPR) repeat protein
VCTLRDVPSSMAFRLGLVVALLPTVACRSEGDGAQAPSAQREVASASVLNNRGVELLREGIQAQASGDEDLAAQAFRAALDCLEQAIRSAREGEGRDDDRAWANKAYLLWRMQRWDAAAAAAAQVRRINPEYVLHPLFVEAMAAAAHPVAPATPAETEYVRKLTNAAGGDYNNERDPFEE